MGLSIEESKSYICKICDYVYDSSLGDPESGVDPCTPFDKLPKNWLCPICSTIKDEFEKDST